MGKCGVKEEEYRGGKGEAKAGGEQWEEEATPGKRGRLGGME